ncbi:hypothetical protein AJ80_02964 [Polytolypa hystricis UAMH7299]|uniref:RlpA-like protein double-psi beta-barrel domain-containing protein n=1 Tax=Polytolypa hystricis (strain UAMH7299) TaxID=1447883 RepID=A0A2B7YNP1_POLH7|nr:hypothetical protein AJ80_02964 [Polytolypa hystricis UAMH7299]
MAPQILKALTAATALFASLSLSAPVQRRAIVWETVVDLVVETVVITKTVAGTPGKAITIPPPVVTPPAPSTTEVPTVTTSSAVVEKKIPKPPPVVPIPTPTPAPAEFAQKPTTAAPEVQYTPPPAPPPPPPPPPAPVTTSKAPVFVSVPKPPPPPPVVAEVQNPPTPPQNSDNGGNNGGSSSSGTTYTGDGTFYDGGLGACGDPIDTYAEDIIALPHGLMGLASNDSPYCGKTVTIKYNGVTSTAKVSDKCMGCNGGSIDLTRKLFNKFAHFDEGRIEGVEWWFNE